MSRQKSVQPIVLCGLLLLLLLSFETFGTTTLKVGNAVRVDSTFIIALVDIGLIYAGMRLYSSKKFLEPVKTEKSERRKSNVLINLSMTVFIVTVFLICGLMLNSSIASVPWASVEWFDPRSNFQLFQDYITTGLFVSQLLFIVLLSILAYQGYSSEAELESEKT